MDKFINKVIQGDCLIKLKELDDNSIDSIVTDPPYHLVSIVKRFGKENSAPAKFGTDGAFSRVSKGFMGKDWDGVNEDGIGIAQKVELWKECLRVLKPGGYLLAFGGTRTYHRMASAIEDAGFEVRDMIEWVYGSGFPKSLSVDKDIDEQYFEREARKYPEYVSKSDEFSKTKEGRASRSKWQKQFKIEKGLCRQKIGDNKNHRTLKETNCMVGEPHSGDGSLTNPFTLEAKQWEGWGTALKPSHEPICMARKPLAEKTVAENVLKYGTGGINIDGCRVGTETITQHGRNETYSQSMSGKNYKQEANTNEHQGRFPANLIHDNSEEVRECFPENVKGEIGRAGRKSGGNYEASSYKVGVVTETGFKDNGNASRFFKSIIYQAKSSKSDRNSNGAVKNIHPTCKPTKLMEYLIKMVTPKGGIVLDPFMGSGTTGIACRKLNYGFIGIELEPDYITIAKARIDSIKAVQEKLL
jgi:DNA modification methylase